MAVGTGGTNLTTSLSSLIASSNMTPADLASICNSIKDDLINGNPIIPGAYGTNRLLHIPNRGVLRVNVGDYVMVDSTGWPILVSKNAIASGPWTHT